MKIYKLSIRVFFMLISEFSFLWRKKTIYLTFDDGPVGGTEHCYTVCKQQNIKATFFMVRMHADNRQGAEIVRLIQNSYPQTLLANHSYTHTDET